MPELPEVETTCRGIAPYIEGKTIEQITIRCTKLRWPIPTKISKELPGKKILSIYRRAKYILINFDTGTLIIHLGMSGRLQTLSEFTKPQKHDHFDLVLTNGTILRYNDPRRFGSILWTTKPALEHKLLIDLGPEPFSEEFTANYMHTRAKNKKLAIKNYIMDSKVVVGVGNIYASEALFAAKIHPTKPANLIEKQHYSILIKHIQRILKSAIKQGGTTLKDFLDNEGKPGYFSQKLKVYGRAKELCVDCSTPIESIVIGQRNTFYCPSCQT